MLWLAVLGACRAVEMEPVAASPCAGSMPGAVPGYAAYRWSEVVFPSGEVHAANWAWQPTRLVTVNVDVASFADAFDAAALLDVVDRALAFWSGNGVELSLGDTDVACCEAGHADCRPCGAREGEVDVFLAAEPDEAGLPAYTRHHLGDDPGTPANEQGCLVASAVRFFPSGRSVSGTPVRYEWVEEGRKARDVDSSDGVVQKPLHDTLVHELGHVVGLGDQDDPSVDCSVMAHCGDPACGCDYDTLGELDAAALGVVYDG